MRARLGLRGHSIPPPAAREAPRGHTPVPRHRIAWKRPSLAEALVYEPAGSDAHLVFQLRPGAHNDSMAIEELECGRDEPVVMLEDAAVPGVGVDNELAVRQAAVEVDRVPGGYHPVVVAVGDHACRRKIWTTVRKLCRVPIVGYWKSRCATPRRSV